MKTNKVKFYSLDYDQKIEATVIEVRKRVVLLKLDNGKLILKKHKQLLNWFEQEQHESQ